MLEEAVAFINSTGVVYVYLNTGNSITTRILYLINNDLILKY